MHDRDFKATTTYSFPCMVFSLCRSAVVPISHINKLKTPQGNLDIVLIRDEANELAPCIGPRLGVPPLGENLVDAVAHARTAMQAASAPTDTTPVESIPGRSTALSSFLSAPSPALVALSRVQKLESQIATLQHHTQPWIQSSIDEA